MPINDNFIFNENSTTIGRRKESTARVFLKPGTGLIIINKTNGKTYLQNNTVYLRNIFNPLRLFNLEKKYDIVALVRGGGLTGQTDSIKLGVSRFLCKMDIKNRYLLKQQNFLTRNPRVVERKKYGLLKARKASQYSKR
jgi:small subunit ribosomal protein S9